MVQKPGLSPSTIRDLKLVLSVSNSYYTKILPLYRKSLEHRRFRRGKVKNFKGLRVKIHPTLHVTTTTVSPHIPSLCTFPVSPVLAIPQSRINPRKRPAFPAESTAEPPCKKLRKLTDTTTIGVHLIPLLKRLQKSLILPSRIMLNDGRWLLIKQRGLGSFDEPPEFPKDLLTIKVPLGLTISHPSK